jgi:hypothetical protein
MPLDGDITVEQRERFIHDHRLELYTMAEICARYRIARKMGFKWVERFEDAGRQGLRDRSRAPHRTRTACEVAAMICAARRQHPSWGPSKLVGRLGSHRLLARHQHRRESLGTPRAGEAAPQAAALSGSRGRPRDHDGAHP